MKCPEIIGLDKNFHPNTSKEREKAFTEADSAAMPPAKKIHTMFDEDFAEEPKGKAKKERDELLRNLYNHFIGRSY